jgi:hypothetical protein
MTEVKKNFLVEISNNRRTNCNPAGLAPREITDFLAEAGKPTFLRDRFGTPYGNQHSEAEWQPADAGDSESITRILSRDSSWFPPEVSE